MPDGGADGVIIAQGGAFGGWSLYAHDGQPELLLQPVRPDSGSRSTATHADPGRRPPGADGVRLRRRRPRQGRHRHLYVDGDKVGEGRVEATVPMVFSADETTDVGRDTATPVSNDYTGETSVVHRPGQLGPDRPRRRRRGPRPPDHAGGAAPGRDGPPVAGGSLAVSGRFQVGVLSVAFRAALMTGVGEPGLAPTAADADPHILGR